MGITGTMSNVQDLQRSGNHQYPQHRRRARAATVISRHRLQTGPYPVEAIPSHLPRPAAAALPLRLPLLLPAPIAPLPLPPPPSPSPLPAPSSLLTTGPLAAPTAAPPTTFLATPLPVYSANHSTVTGNLTTIVSAAELAAAIARHEEYLTSQDQPEPEKTHRARLRALTSRLQEPFRRRKSAPPSQSQSRPTISAPLSVLPSNDGK
jgi:hypothetical protein